MVRTYSCKKTYWMIKAFNLTLVVLTVFVVVSLSGCMSGNSAAPVIAVAPKTAVTKGEHTVTRGESLYLIAWRYGRDIKELAISNQLESPYIIQPGDKISLREPTLAQRESYARRHQPRSSRVAVQERAVAKPAPKLSQAPQPVVSQSKSKTLSSSQFWTWPVNGKLIAKFSQNPKPNKGIDIGNNLGTPVKATKPGKVVYSGQGLRGYGRLLIIKHDDDFLSAYAHNHELLVKEGHYVTQGQTIAKMGKSDTNQVKLHFEIRKNGQPVDPLRYLPKQQS